MTWLLDDGHLSAVLRGRDLPATVPPDVAVATTGYWYVRLCQAVLTSGRAEGAPSHPFAALPPDLRARALAAVVRLPPEIGLASLRDLAPVIGRLRDRHALNILGMEALAASVHLEAGILLSTPSPRLEAALAIEGRPVVVVAPSG